jgi:hypothetical protein
MGCPVLAGSSTSFHAVARHLPSYYPKVTLQSYIDSLGADTLILHRKQISPLPSLRLPLAQQHLSINRRLRIISNGLLHPVQEPRAQAPSTDTPGVHS